MNPGKKIGKYEIHARIGAGGMGEVYLAYDAQLNRDVALKILPEEFALNDVFRQRFKQEARAVSALNHPNIITIYEIGESEDGWFIATEYVEGETLRQYLRDSPLRVAQAVRIAQQIAEALVAAHEKGIVHRDIKPENIMIRTDGYVKVLDFGLAKPTVASSKDISENMPAQIVNTTPGMVMGSVRYMSPEQARGLPVDERTDIWSLGAVLYEMLTGRAAFEGATISDTLAAVLHLEPPRLEVLSPNAPPELVRIVRRMLQKNRDERYQASKDLAVDLKTALYEIEHEISLENRTRSSPREGFDITENPTMIHQTSSANHPTQVSKIAASETRNTPERIRNHFRQIILASLLGIMILTALGYGFYRWFGAKSNSAATAFEKTQISRLNSDGKVSLPAISPDGKYAAYVSGEIGNRSLVVRQINIDSQVTIVPPTALEIRSVVFSPTGEHVYYLLDSKNHGFNTLYQIPTLGGTPKQLIKDVDSEPTFAPDGKRLAFLRHETKNGEDVIYIADLDGSNVQPLIDSQKAGFDFFNSPAWSPDGAKILVPAGKSRGGTDFEVVIAEVSAATGDFKVFNEKKWETAVDLNWLKDGSGFLLIARENVQQSFQIWRVAYSTGETLAVTNDLNSYNGLALSADNSTLITLKSNTVSALGSFAPETKEFFSIIPDSPNLEGTNGFAQTQDGKLIFSRNDVKETNFYIADADGKNPKQLTADSRLNNSPSVTADGQFIVFNSNRTGNWRIWRTDIDGKNPVQLSNGDDKTADHNPQLTPDGKTVLFDRSFISDKQPTAILKVSIEGGIASQIISIDQNSCFIPLISPDGKHLAFVCYNISAYKKLLQIVSFEEGAAGKIEKSLEYSFINSFIWSPDGKSLTYSSAEGIPNLWKLPIEGNAKPQPITDFKSGRIFRYRWSNDGKRLFIVRGIVNSDLVLIRNENKI